MMWFYNSKRRHGSNGQRSPLDYEKANQKWTAPSILDMRPPHFEAVSNASGLIPSRCE